MSLSTRVRYVCIGIALAATSLVGVLVWRQQVGRQHRDEVSRNASRLQGEHLGKLRTILACMNKEEDFTEQDVKLIFRLINDLGECKPEVDGLDEVEADDRKSLAFESSIFKLDLLCVTSHTDYDKNNIADIKSAARDMARDLKKANDKFQILEQKWVAITAKYGKD